MMDWRPNGFEFKAANLVRALFDTNTEEGKLLEAAACGHVNIRRSECLEWCSVADNEYSKS